MPPKPAPTTTKAKPSPAAPTPTGPDRSKGHKARFLCGLLSKQAKAKLTDEQLTELALKEYPDLTGDWSKKWNAIRNHFNKGGFVGQDGPPAIKVIRYDADGQPYKVTRVSKPSAEKASKPPAKTVAPPTKPAAAPPKKVLLKKQPA